MEQKKENLQTLMKLNQEIKIKRGEMTVNQTYKRIEIEEMMRILEEKRRDIISHSHQSNQPNELNQPNQNETIQNQQEMKQNKENKKCGIPFFWVKVLHSIGLLTSYPTSEEDIIALSYLNDVRIRTLPPAFDSATQKIKMGKELIFSFDENRYIKNKELKLHMLYKTNEGGECNPNSCRLVPKTKIQWGINLIEINEGSLFNVFLPQNDHEIEDYAVLDMAFHNFNYKVVTYFTQF